MLPARFSSLGTLLDRVAIACRSAGLDRDCRRRAELALEELFANTIHHAYRGESDRPVWLSVGATRVCLFIEYQDAGSHFDPLMSADRGAAGAGPEVLLGGQGLELIKALATVSSYRRQKERNVVRLEFASRMT